MLLGPKICFPSPTTALTAPEELSGLVAIGGDLTVNRLVAAYKLGIFPWYSDSQPILWWSPEPRAVVNPSQFKPNKSLRQALRKTKYEVNIDKNFNAVISFCQNIKRKTQGTWITTEMLLAYQRLHKAGYAHSIEIIDDNKQWIGGLYGVALGKVFFGESMFSQQSNGSKIAFYHLCEHLKELNYDLIDCQQDTEHLRQLGAYNLNRVDFINILDHSIPKIPKPQYW